MPVSRETRSLAASAAALDGFYIIHSAVKKTPVPCNNNSRYLYIVNTTCLHMSLKITTFGYDLKKPCPLNIQDFMLFNL